MSTYDDLDDDVAEPGRPGEIAPEMLELEKIPRRLWEQTLAPIHRQLRFYVAQQISDERLRELAHELVAKLEADEIAARNARDRAHHRARRTSAPLPAPDARHAAAQPTVQVNLRLRRDDYARLKEAATTVGMKPTTLARALVLNGARKVLEDRGAT